MTDALMHRIKAHRSAPDVYDPPAFDQMADHIKELERERDEARHLQSCACNYDTPTDVCIGHHALFERLYAMERGKLEAKLAKAMKALQDCAELPFGHTARFALDELEKQDE